MLSAQRKEFDEKKKDEGPYPRNFARWYALDYFRRPRRFKSLRFYVTLGLTAVALLLCLASLVPAFHRMHQAGPVSKAHAQFNQDCATCHDRMFGPVERLIVPTVSISDKSCNQCHFGTPHQAKQSHEAACVACHREHQGHKILAMHVADRQCTDCHASLPSHLKPSETTRFHAVITDLNSDHPDFRPSLKGKKDEAKIKFNHKAHLDLDLDALRAANQNGGVELLKGLGAKLACAQCHTLDNQRQYFLPIRYESHCAQCHPLDVPLVGKFTKEMEPAVTEFVKTPLPHKEPAIVRAVLRDRLVLFAQKNNVVQGPAEPPPAARPLPWKPSGVTDAQWAWAVKHGDQTEAVLFMNRQWSKAENMMGCTYCHFERKRDSAGLPEYYRTEIPAIWYKHSFFNHGSHRFVSCADCHDRNAEGTPVAKSQSTADILLPTLHVCQECHRGPIGTTGSAGNACVQCHRYHDRAQDRPPEKLWKLP
jgi:hypothetical protein